MPFRLYSSRGTVVHPGRSVAGPAGPDPAGAASRGRVDASEASALQQSIQTDPIHLNHENEAKAVGRTTASAQGIGLVATVLLEEDRFSLVFAPDLLGSLAKQEETLAIDDDSRRQLLQMADALADLTVGERLMVTLRPVGPRAAGLVKEAIASRGDVQLEVLKGTRMASTTESERLRLTPIRGGAPWLDRPHAGGETVTPR